MTTLQTKAYASDDVLNQFKELKVAYEKTKNNNHVLQNELREQSDYLTSVE